jgi:hypothetical protein
LSFEGCNDSKLKTAFIAITILFKFINMNIQAALESEHSKAQTLRIVEYIGDDKDRLEELMTCFFHNDGYRLNQRAAWPVSYIGEKYPHLLKPYLEKMLHYAQDAKVHPAIKRNTMRTLSLMPNVPENVLGLATDVAFNFLSNPSVPVAIRAYSMYFLSNVCQKIPELKEELRLTIEDFMQYDNTPAFKASAKAFLKQLKK